MKTFVRVTAYSLTTLSLDQVEQLSGLPPEAIEMLGNDILNPRNREALIQPDDGIELVDSSRDGEQIELVLEAENISGGRRIKLRRQVDLVKESDGWKITDPQRSSWSIVSHMPVEMPNDPGLRPIGPGAEAWSVTQSLSQESFNLVATGNIVARQTSNQNKIRWDPRGQFVAVGDIEGMTFLTVPGLEEAWSADLKTSFHGGSISHDGGVFLVDGVPDTLIVPLGLNFDDATPADTYYYAKSPETWIRTESGSRMRISARLCHPTRDTVALAGQADGSHAIYFQPTGGGYWLNPPQESEPSSWQLPDQPTIRAFPLSERKYTAQITALSISPNGRYLAAVAKSRDGGLVREVKLWEIAGEKQ